MTQKEKAKRIGAILDKLYPKPPIPDRKSDVCSSDLPVMT